MTTTPELKRFAESFKSEKDLQIALETVFRNMPNVQGAQITHGPLELGKDLIFYAPVGIEERGLFACVVKKDKIKGTADASKSSARNILIQVQQALDTPHINAKGVREYAAQVYVVSPYDCEPSTMMSVEGWMQDGRKPVKFLCGNALLTLFQTYWPEYLVFESSYLGDYLATLQHGLRQDSALTNLLHRHSIATDRLRSLIDVYVPQTLTLTLHQHKFSALKLPSLHMLEKPAHRSEITALTRTIIGMAQFIPQLQCWSRKGPFGTDLLDLAKKLSNTAERISEEWYRAFVASPHMTAKINNPDKLITQLSQLLLRADRYLNLFDNHLDSANDFAGQNWTKLPELGTRDYLNYCRIEEISDVVPVFVQRRSAGSRTFEYDEKLIDQYKGPLLITGAAGYGKTSFCRWNILKDVEALTNKTATRLPIYIQLHKLAQGPLDSFDDIICVSPPLRKGMNERASVKWKMRVYLDGLDEIPSTARQREVVKIIADGISRYPDLQIIMTARDYAVGPWLANWPRLRLSELNDRQVRELVTNWLGDQPARVLFKETAGIPGLKAVMRIPLLCTLVLAVYRNPKLRRLPENKIRLYELFVNLLCGGWDFAKNISRNSKYGHSVKDKLLTRLAGFVHGIGVRDFGDADLKIAIEETFSNLAMERTDLLDDMLQDGLIVRAGQRYAFAHFSFQEYLAARDLNEPTGEKATVALRDFLSGNEWWREVLSFYIGLASDVNSIEEWIEKTSARLKEQVPVSVLQERSTFVRDCIASYFRGHRFMYQK